MDYKLIGRISFLASPIVANKLLDCNDQRQRSVSLFKKIMPETLATLLEQTIYEQYGDKQYATHVRKYYHNLSPQGYLKNHALSEQWLQGRLDPKRLLSMSNQDLFPERYEGLLTEEFRRSNVHVLQDYRKAADGIVQCFRCKSWKTEYAQKQTRSADEPATNFVLCLKCGQRFKFC